MEETAEMKANREFVEKRMAQAEKEMIREGQREDEKCHPCALLDTATARIAALEAERDEWQTRCENSRPGMKCSDCDASQHSDTLQSQVVKLTAALQSVEWSWSGDHYWCLWCHRAQTIGHMAGCERQAALTGGGNDGR